MRAARQFDAGFRVPGFPTFRRSAKPGVPGFEAVVWQMLVAPAKTPRPIVDKLNRELTAILALPDAKEQIVKYGFLPADNRSVEGLQDFVKSETVALGQGGAATPASPDRNELRAAVAAALQCGEHAMRLRCAASVLPSLRAAARRCAQDYPTRTVTILVPFAPGGGTDLLARAVAQQAGAAARQAVRDREPHRRRHRDRRRRRPPRPRRTATR